MRPCGRQFNHARMLVAVGSKGSHGRVAGVVGWAQRLSSATQHQTGLACVIDAITCRGERRCASLESLACEALRTIVVAARRHLRRARERSSVAAVFLAPATLRLLVVAGRATEGSGRRPLETNRGRGRCSVCFGFEDVQKVELAGESDGGAGGTAGRIDKICPRSIAARRSASEGVPDPMRAWDHASLRPQAAVSDMTVAPRGSGCGARPSREVRLAAEMQELDLWRDSI